MARMLGNNETAFDSAQSQFWVVDAQVLLHSSVNDFQLTELMRRFTTSQISSSSFFVFPGMCFGAIALRAKLLTLSFALNQGLITEGREDIDPEALPFARKLKEMERQGLKEGASLVEVVCDSFYHYVIKYTKSNLGMCFIFDRTSIS